jgi:hypothetical protein
MENGPLRRRPGQEIIEELNNLKINDSGEEFEGYRKEHNWTHKYGLWELPYLKVLILIHNIDIMHQECNFAERIVTMCMNFWRNQKTISKREKTWI